MWRSPSIPEDGLTHNAGSGMALWACPDHLEGPNGVAAGA